MLLAHRRRSAPPRSRRGDRSLGAVLVEAAFITPVFFTLVFGVMELGLAMNDRLAVAQTVKTGARVASASGNDLYADYGIAQAVLRESAALPSSQIELVVVYRASRYGEAPSSTCMDGQPSSNISATGKPCNTYTPDELKLPKNQWGCASAALDKSWCPTDRKITQINGGTEYVGVWMKVRHPWLTRMFGSTLTITETSVIRLEPRQKI